ncbi:GNAT family N-acetyltransferase [Methanosarcina sp. KYL-1]|uniref:GNAT family N-acetyltransferase n=1 Tax=Methanosarcina sp. KYL-1 TaxID=2602068 RepID=UPI0021008C84|nr:GNAT family N-acetyltransferase [Methanosarcina sp. KYL-1]MCQ1537371.1 GNAT family N-acetyltransferase [Methanosarcina sp. KYL-1]
MLSKIRSPSVSERSLALLGPLRKELVKTLDFDDPFFNYFKEKYPGFKKWFYSDKVQNRECWVHYEKDNKIGALLILKIEDEEIESIPQLPKKKRLKICTFKVKSVGNRIGELFIKYAVKFAINEDVSEIYLTHFTEENDRLVELISEYGFRKVAIRRGEQDIEDVFVKEFL